MICRSLFVLLSFPLGHCIVCPSTFGFWLPLWYLHHFLTNKHNCIFHKAKNKKLLWYCWCIIQERNRSTIKNSWYPWKCDMSVEKYIHQKNTKTIYIDHLDNISFSEFFVRINFLLSLSNKIWHCMIVVHDCLKL